MAPESTHQSRKRGGRVHRVAERTAAKPVIVPNAPGQRGGQYQPLSRSQLLSIVDTAFQILSDIGMGDVPNVVMQKALSKGCQKNEAGRLMMPRPFVEGIIGGAAKTVTLYGRTPDRDVEIGGERVFFGTGGAAVQTLDLDEGIYRSSTLQDLLEFTRLADELDNVSWFTRCCVATDVPDNRDLDINTAYALLAGTDKPVGTSFFIGEHVHDAIAMFDMALGGEGAFSKRPFCKVHISPVISPLRFGEDAVDVMLAAIAHNMPINAIIAAQSGATAPAPLAGMLAQSTAETLAALVLVNLFAPGYPVIFSNWPFVIDLRTGAFAGSGGEITLMNAAAAQIGKHFGLPCGVSASMADAKAIDAQLGAEKALSTALVGLAGGNAIYESAGMTGSLLGASFEAFVLDNEMLGHVHRVLRGIEVNEETLGFDAIRETVNGPGHFLGSGQTLAAMQRDYFYPPLANRDDPRTWADNGAKDAWVVAKEEARRILLREPRKLIDPKADIAIRERFNILLPEQFT